MTTRDTFQRQLRAQRTWVSRRPLHVTHVTRDRAIGQGVGDDGKWSRLSHLGREESVADERAAAVEAAAEHQLGPPEEQVRFRLLDERGSMLMGPTCSALVGVTTPWCSLMDSEQCDHRKVDTLWC